jgi:hypothetical protein
MNTTYILLGILVVTVLGKANSVAVAVGVLFRKPPARPMSRKKLLPC